jgi:mannose-1-phosphate guanylyltransferase/phosphomannomutase
MKAIIMAGGEGTRLRPVSANKPKPMVELFDQPALAHIMRLLKNNGITEACLTLKYMPQVISDYFGSGENFGMHLEYRIETEPMGTAGGVLNCADFIGTDDVLIISGDCVCDFDLKALMAFHKVKKAEATLALYSHKEPLEYGLVVTDDSGRITRFMEKPAWDSVVTDQINTGIYVLSASVLREIPAGQPYDFGRELFPKLLQENRALFGCLMEGYWCDIGNVGAYLKCCQDVLNGGIRLIQDIPEIKKDVWSLTAVPESVRLVPPVYIGRNVSIDKGAVLGPGAVIGASSAVASGAEISQSVVSGATIGAGASLTGAVVGRDVVIGRGSVLNEGAAVGDRTVIGRDCRIGAQTKIWPDKQIPDGAAITGIVEHGLLRNSLVFTKPGVITGEAGSAVTPEICLRLGAAAGTFRRVGVAWRGGEAARVLGGLLTRNPLSTDGYGALLELHMRTGDRGAFIARYEEYARMLKKELRVRPAAVYRAHYEALRR